MAPTITWLGHATTRLILADGRVVFIDPWLTDNPSCPDEARKPERCDVILLTHGHIDHVGEVQTLIQRSNPIVVGNYDLCSALRQTIGRGRFEGMNTGGTLDLGGIRVSLTIAFHSSSVDVSGGLVYAGMPNGIVVKVDGLATIYQAGDTEVFGDMRLIAQMHQPRICILPIGDRFTMGAAGAALACEMLEPAAILPIHYGTFPLLTGTPDAFRTALAPIYRERLLVPSPGESMSWTARGLS